MQQQLTIKLSFDLSGNEITTSLSGVKFIAIAKQCYSEMEYTDLGRFRLLIHSCSDALSLDWNNKKHCLRDMDSMIKSLQIFIDIILDGIDGKSNSVNRTRKINEKYSMRFRLYKHRKIAVLLFVRSKLRHANGTVAIDEKPILEFHSDHVYNFPVIIENDSTRQLVVPAGLGGLYRRLTCLIGSFLEIKKLVSNCD